MGSELFGPIAFLLRARAALLHDLGPSLSPQNAFQLLQRLETLPLAYPAPVRQRRQGRAAHPKVAKVVYPGLQTGLDRERADKYLKFGYGGLVGFEPKGGEARLGFIDRLQAAAGISSAFVRASIGIEDPNDIIADIAHALDGV